ncbi:leucine zipper domain-containing protein [uncultured Adlercreutzia sp.]
MAKTARQMGVSCQSASKWLANAARSESISDRSCRSCRASSA